MKVTFLAYIILTTMNTILLAVSDAFVNSLPSIISAFGVILIAVLGLIFKYKLDKMNKNVNGVVTKLLAAKDEVAKAKDDAEKLEDVKVAAGDAAKLSLLEEQKKDADLKSINPPPK